MEQLKIRLKPEQPSVNLGEDLRGLFQPPSNTSELQDFHRFYFSFLCFTRSDVFFGFSTLSFIF